MAKTIKQKYLDFDEYIVASEPHKHERAEAWKIAQFAVGRKQRTEEPVHDNQSTRRMENAS